MSIGKTSSNLRWNMLCIQDPANYMNDLGISCFRTSMLQKLFKDVYDDLQASIRAWDGDLAEEVEQQGQDADSSRFADSVSETARAIARGEDKHALGMLRFALGADYDRLERIRDKVILGGI